MQIDHVEEPRVALVDITQLNRTITNMEMALVLEDWNSLSYYLGMLRGWMEYLGGSPPE